MAGVKLQIDEKRYLARAYAKAAHMENASEGMAESEYWCGVRVGIRKTVNEVFNMCISARSCQAGGKLVKYVVHLDYEWFDVAISEIEGLTDAR